METHQSVFKLHQTLCVQANLFLALKDHYYSGVALPDSCQRSPSLLIHKTDPQSHNAHQDQNHSKHNNFGFKATLI